MPKNSSLFNNANFMSILIFGYYGIFGTYVALAYDGPVLAFFIGSIIISSFATFLRSTKSLSPIFKGMGDILFIFYIAIIGPASYFILPTGDLVLFSCFYLFAITIFYARDPVRIKKSQESQSVN